jgi:hypothetical protein
MGEPQLRWEEPATGIGHANSTANATTVRPPKSVAYESEIPKVAVDPTALVQLPLDQRSGFLLSLMDGQTTIETMLDLCFMPSDEALLLLDAMVQKGIVTFA